MPVMVARSGAVVKADFDRIGSISATKPARRLSGPGAGRPQVRIKAR